MSADLADLDALATSISSLRARPHTPANAAAAQKQREELRSILAAMSDEDLRDALVGAGPSLRGQAYDEQTRRAAQTPARIVTNTEHGNIETRPATEADRARAEQQNAEAARLAARLVALRAEYATLRAEALALGARADMADIPGCPRWATIITTAQFDAACVAHALRALFARCPYSHDAQADKPRHPGEYVDAARCLVAIAREDARADQRAQTR